MRGLLSTPPLARSELSEFKKEIAVGVTIAVVIAATIAVVSIWSIPGPSQTSSSYLGQQSSTTSQISTSSSSPQLTSSLATTLQASSSSSSSNETVQLYTLTFVQDGACSPREYELPWGITLETHGGNQTETVPPGLSLPKSPESWENFSCNCSGLGFPIGMDTAISRSQTEINFTVPSGVYNYAVLAPPDLFQLNGTAIVNGMNTIVPGEDRHHVLQRGVIRPKHWMLKHAKPYPSTQKQSRRFSRLEHNRTESKNNEEWKSSH